MPHPTSSRTLSAACLFLAGCLADTSEFADPCIDVRVAAATGVHLRADDEGLVPPGIDFDDDLDDDDAIAIAIWNNPDFAVALADLGVRRAQLAEAGLLRNPYLWLLFPWGVKQLEFTLYNPLTSLLQRPERIANARSDCDLAAALVVQAGIDVLRNVRLALAEHRLAITRERLARELEAIAVAAAGLDAARLRAGDLAELDADRSAITAIEARRECDERAAAVRATLERLRAVLALPPERVLPAVTPPADDDPQPDETDALVHLALASRPDLHAAEADLESAGARAGLARGDWRQLMFLVDANGHGQKGFEIGPGVLVDIPIFQFGTRVATAEAEVLQSMRRYAAAKNRIELEVTTARLQWLLAVRRRTRVADELLPARRDVLRGAERVVAAGQDSPAVVLAARQAVTLAAIDVAEADAALARARAELERAVGCRLPLPEPHSEAGPR